MNDLLVFQDLELKGPIAARATLADALREGVSAPWSFDAAGSADAERNAMGDKGILVFERISSDVVPAARLVLWPNDTGFYVPNVTPVEMGQLTIRQYNAVLTDFEESARPIIHRSGFEVVTSAPQQSPEDWLGEDGARALRRFSSAANKSTGASHPMDQRRWFDFILTVHRSRHELDAGRLARWLHEVDDWDEDAAHELAGDFERSMALLAREAETR